MSWLDWFITRDAEPTKAEPQQQEQIEQRSGSIENPSVPISEAQLYFDFGSATNAGNRVTSQTAMQNASVFACIRVLSETIAALPWQVFERLDVGKRAATKHPLYRVLHHRPNGQMTSYALRELLVAQACIFGRATALIVRSGGLVSLIPVHPTLIEPVQLRGKLKWKLWARNQSEATLFDDDEIFHIPGLSLDGVNVIAPALRALREAIGMALAIEEHGSRYFSNGARVSGILTADGILNDDARARIKKSWQESHTGLSNAYKTAILEQGLKYQAIGQQNDQAQLDQSRRYQHEEICRVFRVPPIFAGDYSKATFNNSEHQDLHFVKHTILPWCVKIDQEAMIKLFNEDDRYFSEFNMDGILRGDFKTRMDGFSRGIQTAIFTPNEVRALLNMEPVDGGDQLFIQGATVPLLMAGKLNSNLPPADNGNEDNGDKPNA